MSVITSELDTATIALKCALTDIRNFGFSIKLETIPRDKLISEAIYQEKNGSLPSEKEIRFFKEESSKIDIRQAFNVKISRYSYFFSLILTRFFIKIQVSNDLIEIEKFFGFICDLIHSFAKINGDGYKICWLSPKEAGVSLVLSGIFHRKLVKNDDVIIWFINMSRYFRSKAYMIQPIFYPYHFLYDLSVFFQTSPEFIHLLEKIENEGYFHAVTASILFSIPPSKERDYILSVKTSRFQLQELVSTEKAIEAVIELEQQIIEKRLALDQVPEKDFTNENLLSGESGEMSLPMLVLNCFLYEDARVRLFKRENSIEDFRVKSMSQN